jgi:trk system potassium uptake protein TrkH
MFAETLDTNGQALSRPGAIWHGVFHSISSFCNAGFALYDRNMMHGLQEGWAQGALRGNWQIMGVMAPLIVLGGLGFPVLSNCGRCAVGFLRRMIWRIRRKSAVLPNVAPRTRLTLHSKIVLTTSAVLILTGAGILLLIEPSPNSQERIGRHRLKAPDPSGGDWTEMPFSQRAREAVFQSITARTAGFNTIDIAELSQGGKLWMCILMTIGGSPASTAGGMKTVTFALLILAAVTQLRRRREVEAFKRSIPLMILGRAFAIAVLYLSLVVTITILLCIAQGPGYRFIDLLLEACSACGTVGLSTGVTRSLSLSGKIVIICGMFIGRLGPLTLLAAVTARLRHVDYTYPEENVIIG